MQILIENRQHRHPLSTAMLKASAKRVLDALGYPDAQLSIVIVTDDAIASLNEAYLNHAGPTNVISFPMLEGEFGDITPGLLGDVVISADTAKKEADEADMPLARRLNQLLIHGVLHLVGYDHVHSEKEAKRMEQQSQKLLKLVETRQ